MISLHLDGEFILLKIVTRHSLIDSTVRDGESLSLPPKEQRERFNISVALVS